MSNTKYQDDPIDEIFAKTKRYIEDEKQEQGTSAVKDSQKMPEYIEGEKYYPLDADDRFPTIKTLTSYQIPLDIKEALIRYQYAHGYSSATAALLDILRTTLSKELYDMHILRQYTRN